MPAKLRTWPAAAASLGLASSSRARSAASSLGGWSGVCGERGPGPGLAVPAVGGAELAQVALDGQDAAGPAAGPDLLVQRGGAGDAVVPPLAGAGLERVQDAGAAGGLDQQFIDA